MLFLTFWLLFGQAKSNKASRQLKYEDVCEIYSVERPKRSRWVGAASRMKFRFSLMIYFVTAKNTGLSFSR